MQIIRWILRKLILALDAWWPMHAITREPATQARIDEQTAGMALYQFEACPFCVRVRRAMRRLNLRIELRDAKNDEKTKRELLEGGGSLQVPCLRISEKDGSVRWLYESADIISYLESRFAVESSKAAS